MKKIQEAQTHPPIYMCPTCNGKGNLGGCYIPRTWDNPEYMEPPEQCHHCDGDRYLYQRIDTHEM